MEAKTPLSSSVFVAMLLFVILFGFKIADANPLHGGLLFEIVMNDFEPVSLGEFVDNERFVAGHPTKWGM